MMQTFNGEEYPAEYGITKAQNEAYWIERAEAAEARIAELERQVNMWANACNTAISQREAAEARIAELERENAQIVELSELIKTKADEYKASASELARVLGMVEFIYNPTINRNVCPWCKCGVYNKPEHRGEYHTPDCPRQKVLRERKGD